MKATLSLIWISTFFILATFLYIKAYRDIDFAYNLRIIEHDTSLAYCDRDVFGKDCASANEIYVLGLQEFFLAYVFFIVSLCIAFAYFLKAKEI